MSWVITSDFSRNKRGEPQALRDSSINLYRTMFAKFVAQVLPAAKPGMTRRTLLDLSADDIRQFLDQNGVRGGNRNRYVRLLERTYIHLATLLPVTENPAKGLAIQEQTSSNQDYDETVWLTGEQQQAVLSALPIGNTWKHQRNRAMIAAVLGGGLKVSETIRLSVANIGTIESDGSLPVDVYPGGAGRWHRTRITPFAAGIVLAWLETRQSLLVDNQPMPRNLLFPADNLGRALHPATVYRQVASVLSAANLDPAIVKRRGARTLRNTFAVREIATGSPLGLVGEYLGHRADRSTKRYKVLMRKALMK
ncbi:MAG: tyrosine-type recombinase/integrase [Kiritimatiellae bacterium]|nr:tyrosine-type recombinase/integrase [Kiritimatiellia bacterium]